MQYMCNIKFGMLQVRENEISLRKWSVRGTAQLGTLEGTLLLKIVGTQPPNAVYRQTNLECFSQVQDNTDPTKTVLNADLSWTTASEEYDSHLKNRLNPFVSKLLLMTYAHLFSLQI